MSDFMEVKTAELSGAALDWAVATTQGWESDRPQDGQLKRKWLEIELHVIAGADHKVHPSNRYNPSTDWSSCGPLISEACIGLQLCPGELPQNAWRANSAGGWGQGPTPLIAACRAIVASVLGETVSVPKELCE